MTKTKECQTVTINESVYIELRSLQKKLINLKANIRQHKGECIHEKDCCCYYIYGEIPI